MKTLLKRVTFPHLAVVALLIAVSAPFVMAQTTPSITITPGPMPTTYTDGTMIPAGTTFTCQLYGGDQGQTKVQLAAGACGTPFVRSTVSVGVTHCYQVTVIATEVGKTPSPESAMSNEACNLIPAPTSTPRALAITIS